MLQIVSNLVISFYVLSIFKGFATGALFSYYVEIRLKTAIHSFEFFYFKVFLYFVPEGSVLCK